ncbi:CAP domain-containing protein [Kibdelosporangium philippinense]|uniref:CAP domain-containing protein n=1 Tax=Kibdelosporangium philippinense TaxID=211113 RepID=A0ABS8ZMD6_9PSEU|nr:CAP domain-containing protein [Kibdelosporangium philippinense]MCE7007781.1 CAP domain-containing protein [Kibdelosporangium philippinense]
MSETRPRRATIMVGLTALVAGAAIAGGATIFSSQADGKSPEVPLAVGYEGANNARQVEPTPPFGESAKALSGEPGTPTGSTSPTTSSSATSSSTPPSSTSPTQTSSSTPPKPSPTRQPDPPQPDAPSPGLAGEVVALVNQARSEFVPQCGALTVDERLTRSAQKHSSDMSEQNYFDHTSEDGRTFDQRIRAEGYPRPGGENIAMGQRTAKAVMDTWMKSQGHRENILRCGFKTIGVGVDTNGFYWTQNFGF